MMCLKGGKSDDTTQAHALTAIAGSDAEGSNERVHSHMPKEHSPKGAALLIERFSGAVSYNSVHISGDQVDRPFAKWHGDGHEDGVVFLEDEIGPTSEGKENELEQDVAHRDAAESGAASRQKRRWGAKR
eukprot:6054535-Amphidinium_carterae.1